VSETATGTALLPARWPSFYAQAWRRVLPMALVSAAPLALLCLAVGDDPDLAVVLALAALPLVLALTRPARQRLLLAKATRSGRLVVRRGVVVPSDQAPSHLRHSAMVLREQGGRSWALQPYRSGRVDDNARALGQQPAVLVWRPGRWPLRAAALVVGDGEVVPLAHLPAGQGSRDEQRPAAERKARARWAKGPEALPTATTGRLWPWLPGRTPLEAVIGDGLGAILLGPLLGAAAYVAPEEGAPEEPSRILAAVCFTVVLLSVVRWVLAATTGRDVLTGRSVDQPTRSAWTDDVGPDDLAG
jgi:hypothetical protein